MTREREPAIPHAGPKDGVAGGDEPRTKRVLFAAFWTERLHADVQFEVGERVEFEFGSLTVQSVAAPPDPEGALIVFVDDRAGGVG